MVSSGIRRPARLALMADSLSHSMLPGPRARVMLFGLTLPALSVGGLVAALFVALGAQLIARGSRLKEDTALAILYTLAVSLGLVLLTFVKVRVPLNHYLFGKHPRSLQWRSLAELRRRADRHTAARCYCNVLTCSSSSKPAIARSQGVQANALNLLLIVLLVLTMVPQFRRSE
jgi:ABC-type Mn2+/Zn2+ transport system permease subunit